MAQARCISFITRGGLFRELALPNHLPHVKAVTVADVSGAGTLALVALEETGALVAITGAEEWKVAQLGNAPQFAGEVRLHAADLDNNGAVICCSLRLRRMPATLLEL